MFMCQLPYFHQGWDLSFTMGWWRGRVPILIKSGPIRVSSWLRALESVTLRFNPGAFRRRRAAEPREAAALLKIPIGRPTSGRVAREGRMWRLLLDLMPFQGHLLWSHLGLYITINYK